jgi:hypothetical protein
MPVSGHAFKRAKALVVIRALVRRRIMKLWNARIDAAGAQSVSGHAFRRAEATVRGLGALALNYRLRPRLVRWRIMKLWNASIDIESP